MCQEWKQRLGPQNVLTWRKCASTSQKLGFGDRISR
jgi:hypothetical protein